jgi:SNF2 family DNA or RNA helicase
MDVIKSTSPDKNDLFKTSTKIRKILEILKATRETNPGEKTIIFSQFTSMLDLMQEPLKREGFNVCRCKHIVILSFVIMHILTYLFVWPRIR